MVTQPTSQADVGSGKCVVAAAAEAFALLEVGDIRLAEMAVADASACGR